MMEVVKITDRVCLLLRLSKLLTRDYNITDQSCQNYWQFVNFYDRCCQHYWQKLSKLLTVCHCCRRFYVVLSISTMQASCKVLLGVVSSLATHSSLVQEIQEVLEQLMKAINQLVKMYCSAFHTDFMLGSPVKKNYSKI